jgi:hypothetical protein
VERSPSLERKPTYRCGAGSAIYRSCRELGLDGVADRGAMKELASKLDSSAGAD